MCRVPRCVLAVLLGIVCWAGHTPTFAEIPPERAVSGEALQAALPKEIRSELLPGGYIVAIPEPFTKPVPATDPVYKIRTNRALYVYEPTQASGTMTRRVTIHFEMDDTESALRSAHLIARLLRLHRTHFNRESVFGRGGKTSDVWFIPTTPKTATEGGETRDNNVYIFAAGEITTTLELVRTVTHEWGHLTLPAARGYAEPESDASGYLGERLYIKWLQADALPAPIDDGTTRENLRLYYDRQIAPLMERWLLGGPSKPVLSEDRTEAMDYYIGGILDYDEALPGTVLGKALFEIIGETPNDFLASLKKAIAPETEKGMRVRLPVWVPLASGTYTVSSATGEGAVVLKGTTAIRVPLKKNTKSGSTFRIAKPGWYSLSAESGSRTEISVKKGGAK